MCPKCGSIHVKVKQAKGIERILKFWTGKRKYRCHDCFHLFRAADRRRSYATEPKSPTPAEMIVVGGRNQSPDNE
jgi:hypothetical protein